MCKISKKYNKPWELEVLEDFVFSNIRSGSCKGQSELV